MLMRERTYEQHGMTKTPEYQAWRNMITRCLDANWPGYEKWGGRGIGVCRRWVESFLAFFKDVGPRPGKGYSLDRINNEGHYEPGNVRWVNRTVQQQNTRRNIFLTHNGETRCLHEWTRLTGVDGKVIKARMKAGLSSTECLRPGRRGYGAKRKLGASQVDEIRKRLGLGENLSAIAKAYGVSYGAIKGIKSGKTWKTFGIIVPEPDTAGVMR